jgi:hypothetical protein
MARFTVITGYGSIPFKRFFSNRQVVGVMAVMAHPAAMALAKWL